MARGRSVLCLRDLSKLRTQQQQMASAERAADELLAAILPREITSSLIDRPEEEFYVRASSATVGMVDISEFSGRSGGIPELGALRQVGLLLDLYEHRRSRFPACCRVKTMGDNYVFAAGLFAKPRKGNLRRHAEEAVSFATDLLQAVAELNAGQGTALMLRIGMHTGGPIIAGIVQQERAGFDILWSGMNTVARLQETDLPGRVQVSEVTYEHARQLDLQWSPRGEVALKGGQRMRAFLVAHHRVFGLEGESRGAVLSGGVSSGADVAKLLRIGSQSELKAAKSGRPNAGDGDDAPVVVQVDEDGSDPENA